VCLLASFVNLGRHVGRGGGLSSGVKRRRNGVTPSHILTVNNFLAGNTLRFGSDLSSFINASYTGTSFTSTYFNITSTSGGFTSNWNGSTFTITAIPEPSTYLVAAALLGLMVWPWLRRRFIFPSPAMIIAPRGNDVLPAQGRADSKHAVSIEAVCGNMSASRHARTSTISRGSVPWKPMRGGATKGWETEFTR
jgi:hypothetical protein